MDKIGQNGQDLTTYMDKMDTIGQNGHTRTKWTKLDKIGQN